MRILWLLTLVPYPPDTGGKQDSFYLIREFSRLGHEISCAVVTHADSPPDVPTAFAEIVQDVFFLPGNPKALHSRLMASLSDETPFKFKKYYSDKAAEMLADTFREKTDFDFVLVDHLHLAPLALRTRSMLSEENIPVPPLVLRSPNVESTIVEKYADRVDNPLVRAFASRESVKMKKYEAAVLDEFDLVAAISPVDRDKFRDMSGADEKIICVTAGVDTDALQPSETPPNEGEVVFVGSLDWQPNVDGALWFINKVWPSVIEKMPSAHFSLVGKKPPEYLRKKSGSTITITGRVESVEEYVTSAACSVVPLWIGSGMRLKILEAFALGRPVVSTSLGAEGIDFTDGENIMIRDEPGNFAQAVVDVLENPDLQEKLGKNARALVEGKYSWDIVAAGFIEMIESTLSSVNE